MNFRIFSNIRFLEFFEIFRIIFENFRIFFEKLEYFVFSNIPSFRIFRIFRVFEYFEFSNISNFSIFSNIFDISYISSMYEKLSSPNISKSKLFDHSWFLFLSYFVNKITQLCPSVSYIISKYSNFRKNSKYFEYSKFRKFSKYF